MSGSHQTAFSASHYKSDHTPLIISHQLTKFHCPQCQGKNTVNLHESQTCFAFLKYHLCCCFLASKQQKKQYLECESCGWMGSTRQMLDQVNLVRHKSTDKVDILHTGSIKKKKMGGYLRW